MSKETGSMSEGKRRKGAAGRTEGARRATGVVPAGGGVTGPLAPGQRWSLTRKRDVSLRLLRGESMEAVSRELGIEMHRLRKWRDKALAGIDDALREREGDPLQAELDAAVKRVGELSMENELLREKIRTSGPLVSWRSRR
jgi:transposase-like protein